MQQFDRRHNGTESLDECVEGGDRAKLNGNVAHHPLTINNTLRKFLVKISVNSNGDFSQKEAYRFMCMSDENELNDT